uniref:NADH-ubiquinone oxidoreductase chain 2 n=1 Tax=Dolichoris vasculosae TaxID=130022 RepID=A0A8A2F6A8_9HYME|nr:NADH dehydrogenase subunit 2 [Dolichoris vasculosae]
MYLNYYIYTLFMPVMIISNLLALSTSNWFSLWLLMELNLISFIFMMMIDEHMKLNYLMIYFLLQSFCSMLYLFSSLNLFYFSDFSLLMMVLSILVKMGMPPFFVWMYNLMMNLSWMFIYILSSLQKIIPIIILNSIINMNNVFINNLLIMILVFTMIWASMYALNFNSLKILMMMSSILNMSWLILLMFVNEILVINYKIIYFIIMMNLMIMFNMFNMKIISDTYMLKMLDNKMYFMMMLSVLSMAGIPPFFGFILKWMSLKHMIMLPFNLMLVFIICSIISVIFYMRIIYSSMLMYYNTKKMHYKFINMKFNISYSMIYSNWIALTMLLLYLII